MTDVTLLYHAALELRVQGKSFVTRLRSHYCWPQNLPDPKVNESL